MTIIGFAASSWAVLMALAPILQIVRMIRRRSSRDVSIGYFAILIPGFLLWVSYGLVKDDLFLVFPNALAAIIGSSVIVVALVLRRIERETSELA
jgi:uncharacterized protein with PQ loop repeat